MSGSTAKIVPEINLDEFERRLRSGGAAPGGAEDPLAELTRLVNMISRENAKGDSVAGLAQARMPKAETLPRAANDEPPVARFESSQSRAADEVAQRASPPPPPPPGPEAATAQFDAPESLELPAEDRPPPAGEGSEARGGRSRSWYFKTVGLAAVGVALLGGAAAMKFGVVPGLPKRPPFIAAAEGPTKVQPPSDATVQSGADSTALLMKDSATTAPVKVVSNDEQPVDLRSQTTPMPSPVASAPAPAPAPAPAAADAPSPVAPAANTPVLAPAEASSATVAPLFPEAKPVKTVSVRPDGTLISADSTTSPAPPAKAATRAIENLQTGAAAAAGAESATPKLDLPTKLSPPKSSARVVGKTDTTAPAAATQTTPNAPLQLGASARPSKAAKAPPAKAATVVADAAATDTAQAAAKPAAADPAGAGGAWAVQLAAPRSEADAQSAIARLKGKYSDALGGADLAVRKADVKGETIYRVRADGLSKADAVALCTKLKASGGDCFVAKN